MSRCCDRRAFLGVSAAGASAAALVACGGGTEEPDQPHQWVSIVLDSPLEVGGSLSVSHQENQLLLHRPTEDHVLAFSAVCPHEGCTVGIEAERFECPCHGSRFDLQGQWESGPAEQSLVEYQARLNGEDEVQVML